MKFSRSALTVAVLVAAAFSASAQNIAIVNGKAVPTARLDVLAQQIAASGRPVDDTVRAQLKEEVILREIFMQEAQKRGIAGTEDFKTQMELARQTLMIRALFADFQKKNPVSDADVTAYFSLDSRTSRPPDLPELYHLSWPLEGQLGVGKTLGTSSAAPLTLDPFHRTNPFRHAFHPQHGVGYPISRRFSLTVEASPDPTLLTGTYQETTLGLARQDLVAEGTLSRTAGEGWGGGNG